MPMHRRTFLTRLTNSAGLALLAGLGVVMPGCASLDEDPLAGITFVRAENDNERTEFRRRADGIWEELTVPDGAVAYTYEETGRTRTQMLLVDPTRNGGVTLLFDFRRRAIDFSEYDGATFYTRYRMEYVE